MRMRRMSRHTWPRPAVGQGSAAELDRRSRFAGGKTGLRTLGPRGGRVLGILFRGQGARPRLEPLARPYTFGDRKRSPHSVRTEVKQHKDLTVKYLLIPTSDKLCLLLGRH